MSFSRVPNPVIEPSSLASPVLAGGFLCREAQCRGPQIPLLWLMTGVTQDEFHPVSAMSPSSRGWTL